MMDFTKRIIPHSSKEVEPGVWQITLHHHDKGDEVLPTTGKIVEVYDAAAAHIDTKYPGCRMA